MNTEALSYLVDSLKVAAQNPLSFVALIAFVIAVGLWIVFQPGRQYSILTVLGAFAMFIGAITALSFSVINGFSEPKRIYYVGKDTPTGDSTTEGNLHVGEFRKKTDNSWEDVPLNPDESYYFTLKYDHQEDGRFYLVDESRHLRFEVNTYDKKIYWSDIGEKAHHKLYDIVAVF